MSVNEKMTALADAIRAKTGGTTPLSIDQMTSEVSSLQVGAAIIDRSIAEVKDEKVTTIGEYAFYGCDSLTKAIFPAVTSAKNGAFENCTKLEKVELSSFVALIGPGYRFGGCEKLAAIILRNQTTPIDFDNFNETVAGDDTIMASMAATGGIGYFYIPAVAYNAMTWEDVNIAEVFRKIEDYPDICG